MPAEKLKIICVGGGIAACSATIALIAQGHEVHVYERESELRSQGAGLTLPVELVEKLLKDNVISELRTLQANRRKFIALSPSQRDSGKVIWEQSIIGKTLHWAELYKQLRKQIEDKYYHTGCEIVDISSTPMDKASVTLSDGRKLSADLIICADGNSSFSRSKIYPNLRKKYAGYIAWRGIASHPHYLSSVSEKDDECIYYYGTKDGHLIAYNIMDGGKKKLNWVLYQRWNEQNLNKILIDKNGVIHKSSLLPGSLSHEAQNLLHQHAMYSLPSKIAQLVCTSSEVFIQVIYSLKMRSNIYNRLCFLGDAGAIYFPHIGSASAKAIEDSFSLAMSLSATNPIDVCLEEWDNKQKLKSENLHKLSQAMGLNMVIHPPFWPEMDNSKMSEWWSGIIAGKIFYFTEETKNHSFFSGESSPNQNEFASLNQERSPIKLLRAKL